MRLVIDDDAAQRPVSPAALGHDAQRVVARRQVAGHGNDGAAVVRIVEEEVGVSRGRVDGQVRRGFVIDPHIESALVRTALHLQGQGLTMKRHVKRRARAPGVCGVKAHAPPLVIQKTRLRPETGRVCALAGSQARMCERCHARPRWRARPRRVPLHPAQADGIILGPGRILHPGRGRGPGPMPAHPRPASLLIVEQILGGNAAPGGGLGVQARRLRRPPAPGSDEQGPVAQAVADQHVAQQLHPAEVEQVGRGGRFGRLIEAVGLSRGGIEELARAQAQQAVEIEEIGHVEAVIGGGGRQGRQQDGRVRVLGANTVARFPQQLQVTLRIRVAGAPMRPDVGLIPNLISDAPIV